MTLAFRLIGTDSHLAIALTLIKQRFSENERWHDDRMHSDKLKSVQSSYKTRSAQVLFESVTDKAGERKRSVRR